MKYNNILYECVMLLAEGANIWDVYEKFYQDKWDKELYNELAHLDPTCKNDNKGKYLPWILSRYECSKRNAVEGGMKFGFDNIGEVLGWFDKHKQLLPTQYKDINAFGNYQDLGRIYKRYKDGLKTQSEIKSEAEVVFNSPEWEIIIPHSWAASKFYGSNTEWCTTMKDSSEYFDEYTRDGEPHCAHPGPLYINIDKRNNCKYQFQFANGEFFDEHDDPIRGDVTEFTKMPDEVSRWYIENVENGSLIFKNRNGHGEVDKLNYDFANAVYFGSENYDYKSYCLVYDKESEYYYVYDVINDRLAENRDGEMMEYSSIYGLNTFKNGFIIDDGVLVYADNDYDLYEELFDDILFTKFPLSSDYSPNFIGFSHYEDFYLFSITNNILEFECSDDSFDGDFNVLDSDQGFYYYKNFGDGYTVISEFEGVVNNDFPVKPSYVGFDYDEEDFYIVFNDGNSYKRFYVNTQEIKDEVTTENRIIKENTVTNTNFGIYQEVIDNCLSECNDFLSQYGLSVVFNYKYDFSHFPYMAVYQNRSVKNNGRIRVGVNLPLLQQVMEKHRISKKKLKQQIVISIWHEVGHGIMEWLKSLRRKNTQLQVNMIDKEMMRDLKYLVQNEEEIVEEFGAMMGDWCWSSELDDFLSSYEEQIFSLMKL